MLVEDMQWKSDKGFLPLFWEWVWDHELSSLDHEDCDVMDVADEKNVEKTVSALATKRGLGIFEIEAQVELLYRGYTFSKRA